jgi:hypothetical protein
MLWTRGANRRAFIKRAGVAVLAGVAPRFLYPFPAATSPNAPAAGPMQEAGAMGSPVESITLTRGDLSAFFRDNSHSPNDLSGVGSLKNLKDAPDFDAFDPETTGASSGLNFEHTTSGHANPNNRFSPRKGKYLLYPRSDGDSVVLIRNREDSPWAVSSSYRYTLMKPHYLDLDFRCQFHDPSLFGARGYALFFFGSYMNDVADVALHFLGVDQKDGKEKWIAGDAPKAHPDWNHGGTYRNLEAQDLQYDADHNFKTNSWSYDYPRFTKPFYYGLSAHNMVFQIMFNKAWSEEDEIRLSLFKFKLPKLPRPAWDFQYVVHKAAEGKEYGFKARVVWKKFVSPDDCLHEYNKWLEVLRSRKQRVS